MHVYELEPAEYTVVICAYPEKVSPKLIRIKFEMIIFRKKLMNQEDFSFIALQRMSPLHHSSNKTRNQTLVINYPVQAFLRNRNDRNNISFDYLS